MSGFVRELLAVFFGYFLPLFPSPLACQRNRLSILAPMQFELPSDAAGHQDKFSRKTASITNYLCRIQL